jgi:peptide/nickel transport system substrate-binding protein
VPPRDVEKAKRLLREAGVTNPKFTLILGTDPVTAQIGQVLQSMAGEAGFQITLQATDGTAMVDATKRGAYQAAMGIWSGRPDPDGNSSIWFSCQGFLNWGGYCNKEMDERLVAGSALTDPTARVPNYRRVQEILNTDRSHMVLFHFTWLWGLGEKVQGVKPMPDGIIRPAGVSLRE